MRLQELLIVAFCSSACIAEAQNVEVIKNSLTMTLVKIEGGTFEMGENSDNDWASPDELPSTTVQITSTFWMQSTEVTRGMFAEFCNSAKYTTSRERSQNRSQLGTINTWRDDRLDQNPDLPVTFVSYTDAEAFCLWLSGRENSHYRLPTEPEWEFACRAGSTTLFSGTSDFIEICRENCIGLSDLEDIRNTNYVTRTKPWNCGSGRPNKLGLYDMHGNVGEIVDGYHLSYSKGFFRPSKTYLPSPTGIVVRGGSCHNGPEHARCASRMWIARDSGDEWTGFRVVLIDDRSPK